MPSPNDFSDRALVGWLILHLGERESIPDTVRQAILHAREEERGSEWKLELWLRTQSDG